MRGRGTSGRHRLVGQSLAHRQLARIRPGDTLQTTALVHEAYLKVVDHARAEVHDRAHLLALASLAMRHVLVDRAKAHEKIESKVPSKCSDARISLPAAEPMMSSFFGGAPSTLKGSARGSVS